MDQQDQPKQPNWLVVCIVTTIVAGVVQVVVNHFDNIVTLLGGTFSQVHLSVGVAGAFNTISAIVTIGGAVASPLIYSYVRRAKRMESAIRQIKKILEDNKTITDEPLAIYSNPIPTHEELFKRIEEEGAASTGKVSEQSEKPEL